MSSVHLSPCRCWLWELRFHSWLASFPRPRRGCRSLAWSGYSGFAPNLADFGGDIWF